MTNLQKSFLIWCTGGLIYGLIEILFRGYTHWTMILLAFIMSILLDAYNERIGWDWSLCKQALIGGTIITGAEFIVGCIVNLWLGMNVWDYSNLPFNLLGQICPQFWLAWCGISMIAIPIFDWERYYIYILCKKIGIECEPEQKPTYSLFSSKERSDSSDYNCKT